MDSMLEQIREHEKKSIKSTVKFQGNFHQELKTLIGKVEKSISKQIIPTYGVQYTEYGSHNIKVKIKDKNLLSEKLIVCHFLYSKNDEKFGYIQPQFIITEKSQKTKKYDLLKFTITDDEGILNAFIVKLIDIIEEF